MSKPSILVIDDEEAIRKLLRITLESNDYNVTLASTGREGLALAANRPPDLIILDLGLPDKGGHEILMLLREWYTNPIIILSVQSNEEDIIKALDNCANDYLVKPFRTGELLARIRVLLRAHQVSENSSVIKVQDLTIDMAARVVKKANEVIKLTATEYNLLCLLVKNSGKVLTHHHVLKEIWGPGYINQSQYLRVFIAQLRKKIENDPNRPEYIVTESGIGYRFVPMD
jgi:two-component system KDP operon response regulator KdpE